MSNSLLPRDNEWFLSPKRGKYEGTYFFARPQRKEEEEEKSFFLGLEARAKRENTVLRPPFTYGPRKMIECTSSPSPTSGKRDYHVQLSQVFSLPERVEIRDGLEMPSILSRRTSPPPPPLFLYFRRR